MSFLTRSLIATGCVLLIGVQNIVLQQGGQPNHVELPAWDLHNLPMNLGAWRGQDSEVDQTTFEAIGAEVVLNRSYLDPVGHRVVIHMAIFTGYRMVVPHPPRECYQGQGYRITEERDFRLTREEGTSINAGWLSLDSTTDKRHVLFWYQLGKHTYVERSGARAAFRTQRSQGKWQPLVKVMLDTSNIDDKVAAEHLTQVAEEIANWLDRVQDS